MIRVTMRGDVGACIAEALEEVRNAVMEQTGEVSEALKRASDVVLSGHGGPGSPPGVRSGAFRASFIPKAEAEAMRASVESRRRVGGRLLGEMLEHGTSRMAARPFMARIQTLGAAEARRIWGEIGK